MEARLRRAPAQPQRSVFMQQSRNVERRSYTKEPIVEGEVRCAHAMVNIRVKAIDMS